jgi:hypothetical protein
MEREACQAARALSAARFSSLSGGMSSRSDVENKFSVTFSLQDAPIFGPAHNALQTQACLAPALGRQSRRRAVARHLSSFPRRLGGLVPDCFCSIRRFGRSGGLCGESSHLGEADAGLISIGELDAGCLECTPKYREGRVPRFRCFTLKQPNRSHPDAGSICELLLGPVKEASGRSALGSLDHGP